MHEMLHLVVKLQGNMMSVNHGSDYIIYMVVLHLYDQATGMGCFYG